MANGKVTFSTPVAESQFYRQALGSDVNALIDYYSQPKSAPMTPVSPPQPSTGFVARPQAPEGMLYDAEIGDFVTPEKAAARNAIRAQRANLAMDRAVYGTSPGYTSVMMREAKGPFAYMGDMNPAVRPSDTYGQSMTPQTVGERALEGAQAGAERAAYGAMGAITGGLIGEGAARNIKEFVSMARSPAIKEDVRPFRSVAGKFEYFPGDLVSYEDYIRQNLPEDLYSYDDGSGNIIYKYVEPDSIIEQDNLTRGFPRVRGRYGVVGAEGGPFPDEVDIRNQLSNNRFANALYGLSQEARYRRLNAEQDEKYYTELANSPLDYYTDADRARSRQIAREGFIDAVKAGAEEEALKELAAGFTGFDPSDAVTIDTLGSGVKPGFVPSYDRESGAPPTQSLPYTRREAMGERFTVTPEGEIVYQPRVAPRLYPKEDFRRIPRSQRAQFIPEQPPGVFTTDNPDLMPEFIKDRTDIVSYDSAGRMGNLRSFRMLDEVPAAGQRYMQYQVLPVDAPQSAYAPIPGTDYQSEARQNPMYEYFGKFPNPPEGVTAADFEFERPNLDRSGMIRGVGAGLAGEALYSTLAESTSVPAAYVKQEIAKLQGGNYIPDLSEVPEAEKPAMYSEMINMLNFGLPQGYFGSDRHRREEALSKQFGEPLTNEVKVARDMMKLTANMQNQNVVKAADPSLVDQFKDFGYTLLEAEAAAALAALL